MNPLVHAEIDVIRDLREDGQLVASWIDGALEKVITPLIELMGRPIAEHRRNIDEFSQWGSPGEVYLDIGWTLASGRTRIRRWNTKTIKELKGLLEQGDVSRLAMTGNVIDANGVADMHQQFSIHFVQEQVDGKTVAWLQLTAHRHLYGDDFNASVQRGWVDLLQDSATSLGAPYGYLTVDFTGTESPYEQSIGRWWGAGIPECDEWARGYYWGNVLSAGHIERLGGLDRVLADFTGAATEVLATDDPLLYLQLSDDLDHFSDDDLRRLKDFMTPILPSGPGRHWKGYPWRLVEN